MGKPTVAVHLLKGTCIDTALLMPMPAVLRVRSSDELAITVQAGNGLPDNVIALNNLPSSAGEFPSLNIYRTEANGTDFFLLSAGETPGGSFQDDGTVPVDLGSPLDQSVLIGNYSYLVTFAKSGEAESRPSPLVGLVNVLNGRVHLRNLPTPPTPGPGEDFPAYDKVRIYRNLADDSNTFFLVDEIDPGVDYTDKLTDSEIVINQSVRLGRSQNQPEHVVDQRRVAGRVEF